MNWQLWLKGLGAAIINGMASCVCAAIVDPLQFNVNTGLKNLGMLMLVAGAFGAASYLKQSPLPNGQPK